jgi:hypothetical protein
MRLITALKRIPTKWWLIGIALALVAFAFYWVAVRPVLIKQSCSWTTYTEPAKAYLPGITQEQADKLNAQHRAENPPECETGTGLDSLFLDCKSTSIKPSAPRPAEPAREVRRSATKTEYGQCLRHHGLF